MSVRSTLLLAAATMMACAGGSEATGGVDVGPGTSGADSTAGSTQTSIETTGISVTGGAQTSSSTTDGPTSADESTTTDATTGDESTSSSTGSASTTETGDTETDTDVGTDTDGCDLITPDTTCEMGTLLDAVSGDEGGQVSQTGSGSTWFLVHVQETNANIFEEDLSYTVELESPPEVDYDLYVYEGPQDGDPNCAATPVQGTGEAGIETVSAGWDDDQGLGGEDDSLWLAIEIVHVTGTDCTADWTLTVTGGT